MKLKCGNQKCKYEWEYNGKSKFFASCPRCKGSVRVKEKK